MDTNKLIDEMTKDLEPTKHVGCCASRCVLWSLLSLAFVSTALFVMGGLRHNIEQALENPAFLMDNALILIAGLCATFATSHLSRPDTQIRKETYGLIGVSTLIWLELYLSSFLLAPNPSLEDALHNHADWVHFCMIDLSLMIILPTALLFYMIKKSAPVQPQLDRICNDIGHILIRCALVCANLVQLMRLPIYSYGISFPSHYSP